MGQYCKKSLLAIILLKIRHVTEAKLSFHMEFVIIREELNGEKICT